LRRYIYREFTSIIPEYALQMSDGFTFAALVHDRVTNA